MLGLELDRQFILIKDSPEGDASGEPLVHHFVSVASRRSLATLVVSFQNTQNHFLQIQKKLGNAHGKDAFLFVDAFSRPYNIQSLQQQLFLVLQQQAVRLVVLDKISSLWFANAQGSEQASRALARFLCRLVSVAKKVVSRVVALTLSWMSRPQCPSSSTRRLAARPGWTTTWST